MDEISLERREEVYSQNHLAGEIWVGEITMYCQVGLSTYEVF